MFRYSMFASVVSKAPPKGLMSWIICMKFPVDLCPNNCSLFHSFASHIPKNAQFFQKYAYARSVKCFSQRHLQFNERQYKKKKFCPDTNSADHPMMEVTAYATAESYSLLHLKKKLNQVDLEPSISLLTPESENVLHFIGLAKNQQAQEHIFCFEEGAVVFWNVKQEHQSRILELIKDCEVGSYESSVITIESETLPFSITNDSKTCLDNGIIRLGNIHYTDSSERYAFSNALALSVKLGIWEASLDALADSIEFVYKDLKKGKLLHLSRVQILSKCGELFSLRHHINLSSDLLDTPDFYWDREELEKLYTQMRYYLSIPQRTRVINEKLQHCCQIMELLDSHLSDQHHVRLELMIIALILVEVVFELLHFFT